jgi:hypothetical protein
VALGVLFSIDSTASAVIAISVTFLIRLLSVKFNWQTKSILKES